MNRIRNRKGQYVPVSMLERFWDKVIKGSVNDCWEWEGARSSYGYGTLEVNGKSERAHRVSWEIHEGPIPDGLQICHVCDNPPCINPQHLFIGTQSDNMKDAVAKGRYTGNSNPGERNPNSKLTEQDVLEMRRLYKTGNYTQAKLAKMFKMSDSHTNAIIRCKRWKHVI